MEDVDCRRDISHSSDVFHTSANKRSRFLVKSDWFACLAWIKETLMMTGRWQVKQQRGEIPSVKKLRSCARIPYQFTSPGSWPTYRVHTVHVANRNTKVRIIISLLPWGQLNSYIRKHKYHWKIWCSCDQWGIYHTWRYCVSVSFYNTLLSP